MASQAMLALGVDYAAGKSASPKQHKLSEVLTTRGSALFLQ